MNWLRNNWFYLGGVIFIALAFFVGIFGAELDPRQRLHILLFMTMLVHQFEEYALPGGFPMTWNAGACGEREKYDRYPMNKKGSAISNVSFWVVYVIVIFLYKLPVLSIMISYMGFGQVMMHGVMINKKCHTKYTPGLASAVLLMVPVGIYNMWYLASNYIVPSWSWWVAVLILPVLLVLLLLIPLTVTKDENSPYAYTEEEMARFHMLEKLNIR